jgi:hypothetical protein
VCLSAHQTPPFLNYQKRSGRGFQVKTVCGTANLGKRCKNREHC